MISVIIPARNAASSLPALFLSLYEAAMDGLVSEVIIADCSSTDKTPQIADAAGATIVAASAGQQLLAGAAAARKPWLLFIHAEFRSGTGVGKGGEGLHGQRRNRRGSLPGPVCWQGHLGEASSAEAPRRLPRAAVSGEASRNQGARYRHRLTKPG